MLFSSRRQGSACPGECATLELKSSPVNGAVCVKFPGKKFEEEGARMEVEGVFSKALN